MNLRDLLAIQVSEHGSLRVRTQMSFQHAGAHPAHKVWLDWWLYALAKAVMQREHQLGDGGWGGLQKAETRRDGPPLSDCH